MPFINNNPQTHQSHLADSSSTVPGIIFTIIKLLQVKQGPAITGKFTEIFWDCNSLDYLQAE